MNYKSNIDLMVRQRTTTLLHLLVLDVRITKQRSIQLGLNQDK